MKCLRPIDIKNKKNPSYGLLTVPCGKCAACLQNRRGEWTFRLEQELKVSSTAKFITITYADDTVPVTEWGELELSKRDIQLFFKKLRNAQKKLSEEQIRYYMVGEYGGKTDRPHYHILLFNADPLFYGQKNDLTTKIEKLWDKGQLDIGTITSASIHYVTKYVITSKQEDWIEKQKPFALMSRRPAIGKNYITTNMAYHKSNQRFFVRSPKGVRQKLPRYFADKIFTEKEKSDQAIKSSILTEEKFSEENKKNIKKGLNPYQYRREQDLQFERRTLKNDKKSTL